MTKTIDPNGKHTVEIVRNAYQPTKAEMKEPIDLNQPPEPTLEYLAKSLLRPVRIKWINKPKRRR